MSRFIRYYQQSIIHCLLTVHFSQSQRSSDRNSSWIEIIITLLVATVVELLSSCCPVVAQLLLSFCWAVVELLLSSWIWQNDWNDVSWLFHLWRIAVAGSMALARRRHWFGPVSLLSLRPNWHPVLLPNHFNQLQYVLGENKIHPFISHWRLRFPALFWPDLFEMISYK